MPIDAANPKEVAYWQLGDFIYDQNPYGGYDEVTGKPGKVRTLDLGAAHKQLEADAKALRDPREAVAAQQGEPLRQVHDDRLMFASGGESVVVRGPGASFTADDPYKVTQLPPNPSNPSNLLESTGLLWSFDGVNRRVSKAIRITYTSRDKDGKPVAHALLIGYEGGGGM